MGKEKSREEMKKKSMSLSVLPETNIEVEKAVDEILKREEEWREYFPLKQDILVNKEKIILRLIEKKEGITQKEIIKAVKMLPSTVRYVLKILEEGGFIKKKYEMVWRLSGDEKRRTKVRVVRYYINERGLKK